MAHFNHQANQHRRNFNNSGALLIEKHTEGTLDVFLHNIYEANTKQIASRRSMKRWSYVKLMYIIYSLDIGAFPSMVTTRTWMQATNFEETITNRPDFDHSGEPMEVTKSSYPTWSFGRGVRTNRTDQKVHQEIDPHSTDRSIEQNYRLSVSGIAPRPVGFISTTSADGETKNLAPFSYFQVVDHDPPMFIISFLSRFGLVKDTYKNLQETSECVINMVSEHMIEAVSASSIDAPYGLSEWDITGLTEAPTTTVKTSRVKESVFSIEGKVIDIKEFECHKPGMSNAAICLVKATRFWVQQDAANGDFSHIELDKLRPIAQLAGMSYGRISSTFELPRTRWEDEKPKSELLTRLENSASGA